MKNIVVSWYTVLCIIANFETLVGFLGSVSKKLKSIRVQDHLNTKSSDEGVPFFGNENIVPGNPIAAQQEEIIGLIRNFLVVGAGVAGFAEKAKSENLVGDVSSIDLNKQEYEKALLNRQSDDFWYPPFLIGKWNTSMQFTGAKFTNDVPFEKLASNDNTPGFSKYSVIFAPNIGKDISNLVLRFVQIDSHPREDHPFNIRNLVSAFIPSSRVVSAPYDFRKAADWFHSFSNKWLIKYKDDETKEEGTIDLFTRKRDIKVFAGSVETTEFFRQTRTIDTPPLTDNSSSPVDPAILSYRAKKPLVTDYAINWRLFAPASQRDQYITVAELSKTSVIQGQLNIFAYLQPTNDLYLQRGVGKPVGVFTYNVTMERLLNGTSQASLENDAVRIKAGLRNETVSSEYPFVWREDGPQYLDDYFGY